MKKRPTKCEFCGKQVYYIGDKRHVPEIEVVLNQKLKFLHSFHVHKACWKAGLEMINSRGILVFESD